MRKVILLTLILLYVVVGRGNEVKHIWPVSNERFGSQIIYTPGSYIGQEYNEASLFIGGKRGSFIISPVDGKIISVFYLYLHSLKTSQVFSETYFDQFRNTKISSSDIDPLYITLTIGIEIATGDILYLSGIEKDRILKTGKRIMQGDTLGLLAYAYKGVNVPSLQIGRSVNGINSDPMGPLGLKTTFNQNTHKLNPLDKITADRLKADFLIFRESLEEGHPGLYDYIAKPELDKIFDNKFQSINIPLSIIEFEGILTSVVQSVRDKHIQFLTNYDEYKLIDYNRNNMVNWPIRMGWEGNFLLVSGATQTYKSLVGKTIISINGISADSLKKRAEKYCPREGIVKSSCDFYLFTTWITELPRILNLPEDKSLFILFKDGTEIKLESSSKPNSKNEPVLPLWKGYIKVWNRDIQCKIMNDSTALIDLSTFALNDIQIDTIFNFIRTVALKEIPNLIIDVRYNDGGDPEAVASIFSLFAREAFRLTEAEKVNSKSTYDFFQYTQNYKGIDRLFVDYQEIKGKSGYWLPTKYLHEFFPNDTLQYKGHIYILANEHSFSAASLFVSLMRKYKRGMIIGRETANPYNQMYADKFAHVVLPNTQIIVRIPLIKKVFDTTKNINIQFGRGVLPDYEIPLQRLELEFLTDTYVEKANELIAQRIFLRSENSVVIEKDLKIKSVILVLAVLGFLVIISVVYFRYYSKT